MRISCLGLALLFTSSIARAGPYSTGLQNQNSGAVDPAVAGFVAPEVLNPMFAGWATDVISYQPAPGVEPGWNNPAKTLGPVTGDNFDIASLGDSSIGVAGQITLSFAGGIRGAPGPDFVVFENALGSSNVVFAELAYVEVSSDGEHFVRFPSVSLTPSAVGPYGSIDPTDVHNLAGKHVNAYGDSWGTPFDLDDLPHDPQLNVHGIRYVRLIDIPGDGASRDSQNRPIYDAWLTFGSGGFDLEAIGVTNAWLGGDANLDGAVDITDLGILASNWQQSPRDFTQGDFDLNGLVDIADLGILATHWQQGAAASLRAVPEPAISASLFVVFICLRRRREMRTFMTIAFALLLASQATAVTSDFEDKTLSPNSFYNGADSAGGFISQGVHYSNNYESTFGSWSGFAYSNVNNTASPGFGNQYAAITGSGFGGGGINGVSFDPGPFGSPPVITLPFSAQVQGLYVTNTTYAYLAVRDGNDGAGFVRQFGDDPTLAGTGNQGFADFLKLTITGKDQAGQTTGAVNFFLADYRFASNAQDYVVNDWRFVDLSILGQVKTLSFAIDSTDTGQFGINTPTYFALDNLTFVPEPAIGGLLFISLALYSGRGQGRGFSRNPKNA